MTRALSCSLLALVIAVTAAAPAAGHGVIRREGSVLRYTAPDPGIGADLHVSSPRPGTVQFSDKVSPGGMDWGPCIPVTEKRSTCSTRGVSRIEVEVYDGDDKVTVRAATPVRILAGEGNDRVAGGYGADVLTGGSGADAITGGDGRDILSGDEGDDSLEARDGAPDQLACGAGSDRATTDPSDPATECESLARGAARRDRDPPRPRLAGARLKRVKGARSVQVRVSMDEPGTVRIGGRVLVGGRVVGRLWPARARPDAPDQVWTVRLRLA